MVKSGAITAEEAAKFADRIPSVKDKKDLNRFGGTKGFLLDAVRKEMESAAVHRLSRSRAAVCGSSRPSTTRTRRQPSRRSRPTGRPGAPSCTRRWCRCSPARAPCARCTAAPTTSRASRTGPRWPPSPARRSRCSRSSRRWRTATACRPQLNGNSPLFIDGKEITVNQGDSGGASFGNVPLSTATAKSINTAFVDLTIQMAGGPDSDWSKGADKVLKAANQAGIPASDDRSVGEGRRTSRWATNPVAPVDMANAYATLAAGGKRADWYVVETVKDFARQRRCTSTRSRPSRRSTRTSSADTLSAMQGVVTAAAPAPTPARSARPPARPAPRRPAPTRTSTCRRPGSPASRPSWRPR